MNKLNRLQSNPLTVAEERQYMKKLMIAMTAVAITGSGLLQARAGDREWATAGKVLTGIFAASVVARAVEAPRVYTYEQPVIVQQPVVYAAPAQVVVQQAPVVPAAPTVACAPTVVQQPQPVYVAQPTYVTAPVVVQQPVYVSAPVYCAPAPVVSVRFGYPCHSHHIVRGYFGRW